MSIYYLFLFLIRRNQETQQLRNPVMMSYVSYELFHYVLRTGRSSRRSSSSDKLRMEDGGPGGSGEKQQGDGEDDNDENVQP